MGLPVEPSVGSSLGPVATSPTRTQRVGSLQSTNYMYIGNIQIIMQSKDLIFSQDMDRFVPFKVDLKQQQQGRQIRSKVKPQLSEFQLSEF